MRSKIKSILTIIIGILACASTQTHAALSVKPATVTNGSNVLVNTSISNSYMLCQQMTNAGESLYGTTVRPHLATNKDWGAVSYLSQSTYGTNSAGQNTGTQITINGVNYYSTNGNATGVMNWGSNPNITLRSQTSGIINAYIELTDKTNGSTADYDNVKALDENKATDFVEVFSGTYNSATTKGMAMMETQGIGYSDWKYGASNVNYPTSIRNGLFGFVVSNGFTGTSGADFSIITFRPVIWN
ncbi:MAG: hypothetical protein IJJ82_03085 [Clostridia bacterium]|nr:hypothetical protein [Clostridia bacterium]